MTFTKPYGVKFFFQDLLIGVILAFVSIPISMGYAQVAGLPVSYGLYGSLLPPLIFALFSTSPRFFFGVDAAPAALIGGMLASMSFAGESAEALRIIPAITFLVSLWLLFFYFIKADRVLKFISEPVMGGFITGIGTTIILMQAPKLFGGSAGKGEALELLKHLVSEGMHDFHFLSLALGLTTIIIILLSRHFFPKLPMQAILMFAGAAATYFFHLESYGVKTLSAVEGGLPPFALPDFTSLGKEHVSDFFTNILIPSASIAVVILSETLLATSNVSKKNGDKIFPRKEILTYALCNFSSAISGSCPVNGSVSRTGIASQFGVKSQVMSLSAAFTMLIILLFGTGFIKYLPVPVLTAIVISALLGTLEFSLAHKLKRLDKAEFFIFYAAFIAVLLLGTIYGVIVGVLLASLTFIIRQTKPATDFLGVVPNLKGYYSLTRKGSAARPIKNVVLYKFSSPLFYANINQFCKEIEEAVKEDTKVVVVDASGITSVDTTAAESLLDLYHSFEKKKIKFFLAAHVSKVNDQLREFGARDLIEKHAVSSRIAFAMDSAGITRPYELESEDTGRETNYNASMAEFEWAFGNEAEEKMQQIARRLALEISEEVKKNGSFDQKKIHEKEREYSFGYWDSAEEEEFLDILSMHLDTLYEEKKIQGSLSVEENINRLHKELEEKLLAQNTEAVKKIIAHRMKRDEIFKKHHPKAYRRLELEREKYFMDLLFTDPELAKKLADIISSVEE